MLDLKQHPLRAELAGEVHARPPLRIAAPARVSHLVMYTGEASRAPERAQLRRLCEQHGVAPPGPDDQQFFAAFGDFALRWERHTEFTSWTFVIENGGEVAAATAFDRPALEAVAADWVGDLPGELIAAVHIAVMSSASSAPAPETVAELFDRPVGGSIAGEAATVWGDFKLRQGATRFLIHDRAMTDGQRGRAVQRLLELETYRVLALMAFPLARRFAPEVTAIDRKLSEVTGKLPQVSGLEARQGMLTEMLALGAEIERIAAATNYRFGAAAAYYELVERRIEELREARTRGLQPLGQFLHRRLTPAMRTCASVRDRQETLSRRLARASNLLRTSIELDLAEQNGSLLASMDRRARLQLRLQRTVEGLSIIAISYYAVGLISYLLKAAKPMGIGFDTDIASAVAVPVALLAVWLFLRQLRRALGHGRATARRP